MVEPALSWQAILPESSDVMGPSSLLCCGEHLQSALSFVIINCTIEEGVNHAQLGVDLFACFFNSEQLRILYPVFLMCS